MELENKGYVNKAYVENEDGKENPKNGGDAIVKDVENPAGDGRATWGNSLEFLMSCIAMSVGLGNIWRFPFTAYENGGGAFLIPYIIVLILVGKPMYYMEMAIGQFTSRNNIRMWVVMPGFKGVGVGQLMAALCVVTYYVSLLALSMFYLINSFSSVLPWTKCLEEWENCFSASQPPPPNSTNLTSSSEYYFLKYVLREFDNIDNGIGLPDWRLTLCLFISWVLVFLIMIKGVKSSGKASYFLALFPYVVMFALLIRAVTLEGAVDGIIYFIKPDWNQLYNPKVWYAATTQCFFSLGVCMGAILMLSSYNKFDSNIYRDTLIVTTLDTFTSLLAGFTIFGILGNLAHEMGEKDISAVVGAGGTGLAFISYPNAIAKFDVVPQLFAVLFFLMLLVLGLGSAVSIHSGIVTVLADRFNQFKFWQNAMVASIIGFLIGLVYVTPGGQYVLTLVDKFGGTFLILGMAICEIAGVFWLYGLENFCEDIEFMTGRKVSKYWRWCWGVVTPLIMIIVFVYAFVSNDRLKYGDKEMPLSAHASGWTLLAFGLLQLPIWALIYCLKSEKITWREKIREAFTVSEKWGPRDPKTKENWKLFKEEAKKNVESFGNPKWKHILYSLNGTYRNDK